MEGVFELKPEGCQRSSRGKRQGKNCPRSGLGVRKYKGPGAGEVCVLIVGSKAMVVTAAWPYGRKGTEQDLQAVLRGLDLIPAGREATGQMK